MHYYMYNIMHIIHMYKHSFSYHVLEIKWGKNLLYLDQGKNSWT